MLLPTPRRSPADGDAVPVPTKELSHRGVDVAADDGCSLGDDVVLT